MRRSSDPRGLASDPGPTSGSFPRRHVARTADVEQAQRVMNGVYAEGTVEPVRGQAFQFAAEFVPCGTATLSMETWPGGVLLKSPAMGERYVLVTVASGTGEGDRGREPFALSPGRRGALLSPGLPLLTAGSRGFAVHNFAIERGALEGHLAAFTGRVAHTPIAFDASVDLESAAGATLLGAARLLRQEVERPGASPHMIASLRDAFYTALLTCVPHGAAALLDRAPPSVAPGSVRRAEEYIAAHAGEPLTLADIVMAAGVPARSLRAAFVRHRGVGPMEFLKLRRMDLARRRLVEGGPGVTVKSVIAALGLGDAGRFSMAYKKRFGESPRETLARGRAWAGPMMLRHGKRR